MGFAAGVTTGSLTLSSMTPLRLRSHGAPILLPLMQIFVSLALTSLIRTLLQSSADRLTRMVHCATNNFQLTVADDVTINGCRSELLIQHWYQLLTGRHLADVITYPRSPT